MRGDVVLVALPGDYGKPRPCVVVQGILADHLPAVTVCPLTSFVRGDIPEFRISVQPDAGNGLRSASQVMTDKLVVIDRAKLRDRIGQLTEDEMSQISTALTALLGLD